MARISIIPLLLLAAIVSTTPAAGQTVRGELVESGGGPVERVLVVLLDGAGRQQGAALTDSAGAFAIRAPGAGRYTLRAERIGYATTTSAPFALAAGETRTERLVAEGRGIVLRGIVAEAASRRCRVRPETGIVTATLWEEARKALNTAAYTQSQRLLHYEVVQWTRDLDASTGAVRAEKLDTLRSLARHPFTSLPPADLSANGYVREVSDGTVFYGPDVNVLLSAEFLNDHCLRLAEGAAGDTLVGLEFEPVRGRSLPDIRGVLWLSRATAELRRVDFAYTEMPGAIRDSRLGGTVELERLASGPWIVRRWAIRMPQVEVVRGFRESPNRGRRTYQMTDNARLSGIREDGGEVTRATLRPAVRVQALRAPPPRDEAGR